MAESVVWCDASVDQRYGLAFGAYIGEGMIRPAVVRVAGKSPVDAEILTMVEAIKAMPRRSLIMTDLAHIVGIVESHKGYCVNLLLAAMEQNDSFVQYCQRSLRKDEYHMCHLAAREKMRQERRVLRSTGRRVPVA